MPEGRNEQVDQIKISDDQEATFDGGAKVPRLSIQSPSDSNNGSPLSSGNNSPTHRRSPFPAQSSKPTLPPVTEQLPGFLLTPKRPYSTKSLTSAELASTVMSPAEVAAVAEELKTAPPPLGMEEVRARKKSITEANKETRKTAVAFIRARTASRAAAQGIPLPSQDALGTTIAEGPPKTEDELGTCVSEDPPKTKDALGTSITEDQDTLGISGSEEGSKKDQV